MKYSAQICLKTESLVKERYTDEETLYNYFKELFWKGRERVEEETFSTRDVLNKLSAAFKNSGITNLVRISHDDTDFYLDKNNKPHDLDNAIGEFGEVLHNAFERFYEEVSVVMETSDSQVNFVVELTMHRIHPIGEYPIQINFSGLPENTTVTNVEKTFNLFVNKVEQNIQKYLNLSDVTISFTKKSKPKYFSELVEKEGVKDKSTVKTNKKCKFFPLYGVTLGKTSVKELANKGTRAKDRDDKGKKYKYYTINDMRFWYGDDVANHIYMTYTDPLPQQWRECGLDWDLSYNEWQQLFKDLGFMLSVVKRPKKEWYSGKFTLVAQFNASKKISDDVTISFEVYFNYSQKTSRKAEGTIYSLRVRGN
jgi:hypothetical protein